MDGSLVCVYVCVINVTFDRREEIIREEVEDSNLTLHTEQRVVVNGAA